MGRAVIPIRAQDSMRSVELWFDRCSWTSVDCVQRGWTASTPVRCARSNFGSTGALGPPLTASSEAGLRPLRFDALGRTLVRPVLLDFGSAGALGPPLTASSEAGLRPARLTGTRAPGQFGARSRFSPYPSRARYTTVWKRPSVSTSMPQAPAPFFPPSEAISLSGKPN